MMNKVDWNRVGSITDTSLKVASPGIVAAGLIGGPLAALGAAGAVVGGNVIGSALYDKVMQIKDERARRKAFKELQEHVLAENGILEYPGSNVQVPFAASEGDFNAPALAQIAKGLVGSAQYAAGAIGSAGLGAKAVALNAVLRKPISIAKEKADDAVESTAVGRVGKRVVKEVGNAVSPVFVRKNYSECKHFSEDSLISVSDEDISRMASCIECAPDSEKKLSKDRYLSMLDEDSREKLIEELDKRKAKDEPCPCVEPVSFSECPNLQAIAKGRDFSALGNIATAFRIFTKGSKVANTSKVVGALSKASPMVNSVSKSNSKGGIIGSIAHGVGEISRNVKEGFNSGLGKAVETAGVASKASDSGAGIGESLAKNISKTDNVLSPNQKFNLGNKFVDEEGNTGSDLGNKDKKVYVKPSEPSKEPESSDTSNDPSDSVKQNPKTRLSEIQDRVSKGESISKDELRGIRLASKSKTAAILGESMGYDNLAKLNKTVTAISANQTAEAIEKKNRQDQQNQNR